jgi:hypothetical protein
MWKRRAASIVVVLLSLSACASAPDLQEALRSVKEVAVTPFRAASTQAAEKRVDALLRGVRKFREVAVMDHELALALYAAPRVVEQFRHLDRYVWPAGSPRVGWSYFLHVSVLTAAGADGDTPLVAFYNPWADVFLVTAWQAMDGTPRMIDADLVAGEWIRRRSPPPFDPTPAWRRGDLFRPAALGLAVAESLQAFEALFPSGADWRRALPGLETPRLLIDQNYLVAAHHLLATLLAIDELRTPGDGEDPRLASVRSAVAEARAQGAGGRVRSLVAAATETLPATQRVLLEMPPEVFGALRVVAAIVDADASLVFLAPLSSADYCVSFLLRPQGDRQHVSRIDVVHYAAMYASAQSAGEGGTR